MSDARVAPGDGPAIAAGALGGSLAGAVFGFGIVGLLGGAPLEVTLIVVVHTAAAMMAMGAWTAPCLLKSDEEQGGKPVSPAAALPKSPI